MDHRPTVESAVRAVLKNPQLSYREVARQVRGAVPLARTSSRSVASTVSRLRRRGYKIPDRRYANHA